MTQGHPRPQLTNLEVGSDRLVCVRPGLTSERNLSWLVLGKRCREDRFSFLLSHLPKCPCFFLKYQNHSKNRRKTRSLPRVQTELGLFSRLRREKKDVERVTLSGFTSLAHFPDLVPSGNPDIKLLVRSQEFFCRYLLLDWLESSWGKMLDKLSSITCP